VEEEDAVLEAAIKDDEKDGEEGGVVQAAMESLFSKQEIFTLSTQICILKITTVKTKDKGLIKIIEDDSEHKPTYNVSANLCFPHFIATEKCQL